MFEYKKIASVVGGGCMLKFIQFNDEVCGFLWQILLMWTILIKKLTKEWELIKID
mgnify:FL=1